MIKHAFGPNLRPPTSRGSQTNYTGTGKLMAADARTQAAGTTKTRENRPVDRLSLNVSHPDSGRVTITIRLRSTAVNKVRPS